MKNPFWLQVEVSNNILCKELLYVTIAFSVPLYTACLLTCMAVYFNTRFTLFCVNHSTVMFHRCSSDLMGKSRAGNIHCSSLHWSLKSVWRTGQILFFFRQKYMCIPYWCMILSALWWHWHKTLSQLSKSSGKTVGVTKEISFRVYVRRVKLQIPSEGETFSYQNEWLDRWR